MRLCLGVLSGLVETARRASGDVTADSFNPFLSFLLSLRVHHENTTTLETSCLNGEHSLLLLIISALVTDEGSRLELDEALCAEVSAALEVPELRSLEHKPAFLPCLNSSTLLCQKTVLVVRLQARN